MSATPVPYEYELRLRIILTRIGWLRQHGVISFIFYCSISTGTRLGGCTGDLGSCANVPSTSDPKHFLHVVLSLFGPQLQSPAKLEVNPGGRDIWVGKVGKMG